MNTVLDLPATLSFRLKHGTNDQHERMHALMEQGKPFESRERYAGFVAAQYIFQRDVEHLFDDARIQAAVPDLAVRGRVEAAVADMQDLDKDIPQEPLATGRVAMPQALGWLYVSEGSTLGAAFLLKQVQQTLGLDANFGARNLAAYPEGRALVWRRFVAALDSDAISAEEHDAVLAGANAAYDRFGDLLQRYLLAA
ncbi:MULTISPECIES: biliverdin-producing heme oxygenase [unclassified Achromobacter]|uniref:biliverdin-producing heme oxygenase n=1 Tax=unclassified Achromobacter TaxID=2626865 RepID=UPI000B514BEF|nr:MULTISPECIES: biliverdin-producing heme oxygenase [unclassified Achromobacter]OWT80188.1 biliverdin-producing heme oxygenase [Achromobacter sp. HZ34]OWT82071.1 biliverdin-producing heme oxygenase [Achromobacter sp. HZ28]